VTVVVTGAGGFLGSAVVRALVAADVADVVAVTRPGRTLERLAELGSDALTHAEVDLAAPDASERLRALEPQAIIHVALDRGAYARIGDRFSRQPVSAAFAALAGVRGARLIHTSSAWVLHPGDRLAEEARVEPRSPYGHNKARADEVVPILGERHRVRWLTLRPFNLFGRYEDRGRLVPSLVESITRDEPAALSHGNQVRDFNDVDAVAAAYVAALRAPDDAYGSLYHVGSGRGTSTRELALLVAGELGRPDLLRFGVTRTADDDVGVLVSDPTRIRQRLGWSTPEPLESVVRRTVAWWVERLSDERRGERLEHEALT
jgi:nucleoside-diphosphate-sugar epimerase